MLAKPGDRNRPALRQAAAPNQSQGPGTAVNYGSGPSEPGPDAHMPRLELIFIKERLGPRPLSGPMTRLLHHMLGLTLVLAVTLATAHAMPLAVGNGRPMEICGENGIEILWIDASGTPIPTPAQHDCRICPDCLAADTGTADLLPTVTAPSAACAQGRAAWLRSLTLPVPARLRPAPRGPPAISPTRAAAQAASLTLAPKAPASIDLYHPSCSPFAKTAGRPAKDACA